MDNAGSARAREKARRAHRATEEMVVCHCSLCKGCETIPHRTAKSHAKRDRQRAGAVGISSPIAGPSEPAQPSPGAFRHSSRSPTPIRSPLRVNSLRATPSPPPRQFSPESPARPRRSSSPLAPPGSPNSLHSAGIHSRHSSPGVQHLVNRVEEDAESDGNLSDLAAERGDFEINDRTGFFARLLEQEEDQREDLDLGFEGPAVELARSPDGSDFELNDADLGLPDENAGLEEPPRFEFDENLEPDPPADDPGDDPDPFDDNEPHFAAFNEPDVIRNAYVDAFVQKTHFLATHSALNHQLKTAKRTISANPDVPREALDKMAQTIRTAEKRLGLSTSDIIITYLLCPVCKRRYEPGYAANAEDHTCINIGCTGTLYTEKILASRERRRAPSLTYPTASLKAWVRRFFSYPGNAELIQNWRTGPDDEEELTEPIHADEWKAGLDRNAPLGDISDGFAWRERYAGMRREVDEAANEEGGDLVYDYSTLNPPVRFSSLQYGLSLSMNTDWFEATKDSSYSVGAVYFVINNLPRHLRFLRENICLAAIMPGPNEPGQYALDQMLEPIVQELLELQAGVEILVRKGDPADYELCMVYCDLCHHIADLIARIKMGGGAGVASEHNFCLYCRSRLSSISVRMGFIRKDFPPRIPHEELQNVYYWKSLESDEDRELFFEETGTRFTMLHELPGWHTVACSPIDAMHLLYLGAANWIFKQIIVGPNLLAPRQPDMPDPIDIYNTALEKDLWLPYSVGRLPPKIGQSRGRVKADQLKLMTKVMFIPLYLAMRDGDGISELKVPRGTRSSTGGKHQLKRAKLLQKLRAKHFAAIGQPHLAPDLADCFPSRNLAHHYRQILRFCVATSILDSYSISPNMIKFAQDLLETLCVEYTRMNVQLSPTFHYMQHLEEFMLQMASLYNSHVWGMERMNAVVGKVRHNGRGSGVLEGTMMRGWWEHASLRNLIRRFEALPNRTPADEAIIQDLLMALRGGPEHAQQRGTLMAYIAQSRTAYARIHGIQEPTRLSNQSTELKMDNTLWRLVVGFCNQVWPDAGIFGPDAVRDIYLPQNAVRNYSYVEHDTIRYGSFLHTSGRRACYGYTNGRLPVRVERILLVEFPDRPHMRTICVIVRRFCIPDIEPVFPWQVWQGHLGVNHWEYNHLSELVAIPVADFTGIFALLHVPMSYGQYWVTIALNKFEVEEGPDDGNADGEWV